MLISILRKEWPRGGMVTEDCKSFYPSSILGVASKKLVVLYN